MLYNYSNTWVSNKETVKHLDNILLVESFEYFYYNLLLYKSWIYHIICDN